MSRPAKVGAIAVAATLSLACFAMAQTPVQPQPRDPNMPSPQNTPPEKIEPGPGSATGSTGTLSDRLERSDGVIRPPANMDSGMVRPAPDTGTTPVIPPAGSPGSARPNADPR